MSISTCIRTLLEIATEPMMVIDLDGKVLDANRAFYMFSTLSKKALIGSQVKTYFVDASEVESFFRAIKKGKESYHGLLSFQTKAKKPQRVHVDIYYFNPHNDMPKYVLIKVFSQLKDQSVKGPTYMGYETMLSELNKIIEVAKVNQHCFITAVLSLDQFNLMSLRTNKHLDEDLLHLVALRLQNFIQPPNLLHKIGSSAYLIVFYHVATKRKINHLFNNILKEIAKKYIIGDEEYLLTASIGICEYSQNSTSAEDLFRYANFALINAKEQGGNHFQIADPNVINLDIEKDLRQALDNGEFFLEFQPIISLVSGQISRLEALIRWKTVHGTIKYPDEFISDLERFNLMNDVGEYVIDEALKTLKILQQEHDYEGDMAINFSASQLNLPLIRFLLKKLDKYVIKQDNIWIELTENNFINPSKEKEKVLNKLKQLKFKLSIDDFGVKYSALNYLNRIPVDGIKIDKTFIEELPNNRISKAIVSGILMIGKMLNLTITAEGIEHRQQLDYLLHGGCSEGQGFLLGRPLKLDELVQFLKVNKSHTGMHQGD